MAMKILGHSPIKQRTIMVPIGKDAEGKLVELEMRPVKFGKLMEIEADIPVPVAPSTGVKKKDPRTGQVLKRNGQYVMVRDEEDPKHLSACELREMAVKVATIVAGLGDQLGDIPERDDSESGQDYWLRVLDDMTDAGIDTGIFTSLCLAAQQLSKPMNNLELLLMRQALGTEGETDATTEEKETAAADQAAKAEAEGKAPAAGAHSSTTSS